MEALTHDTGLRHCWKWMSCNKTTQRNEQWFTRTFIHSNLLLDFRGGKDGGTWTPASGVDCNITHDNTHRVQDSTRTSRSNAYGSLPHGTEQQDSMYSIMNFQRNFESVLCTAFGYVP